MNSKAQSRRAHLVKASLKRRHLPWLALAVAASLLGGGRARGGECLQWIKRTDVGSYGQRWQHAMAYDSDRGVTVFFGGEIGKEGEETYFNDTQEFDGRQWKQISTAVKPGSRSQHAMVYDPVRKQIVMFGGFELIHVSGGFDTRVEYSDTWVYSGDGTSGFWELKTQATNLPPSYGHEMVWDTLNQVVLLHIGPDSWAWNGSNWLKVATNGPSTSSYGMAFDSERATAMIVGGFVQGGVTEDVYEKPPGGGWEYRGPGPSRRAQLAMAYDERRKRAVLVGGVGESIETGETAYEHIPGTGWITLPSLPSGQGRAGSKMVYDSKRGVMVLTGGAGGGAPNAANGGRYSDTWELWPSLFISGQPSSATNLACTTATFSVLAMGAGPFQYQWRLDGRSLSDDTHFSGSRTPDLTINGLRYAHGGKYDVVVRDSCGPQNVVTSRVATLTIEPGAQWVLRATNGPPIRFYHAMAYDSARRVTVLFGGQTNWNGTFPFNDLWEWDGVLWTQRMANSISNGWAFTPSTGWSVSYTEGPARRARHAMAYDSRRGRIVLFGGQALSPDGTLHYLRDLWEWDGLRWHFRATNGPISRSDGSMAYDERRGRTVLFGGQSLARPGEVATDWVWEWDGARWHTNQPPASPSGSNFRAQSRMTYDSFRGVTVFGPTMESYSQWAFWDWDGVKWTTIPVVYLNDPVAVQVNGTGYGALAFDQNRRRSTWFGGFQLATVNRTLLFDGKDWTLMGNSVGLPARRIVPAMAYDSGRGAMVMFGGSVTYGTTLGATNDTWELIATDLPLINEQPVSQYRLAGGSATFGVSAVSPGFLTYQWHHNGTPIPGATASTFTIPDVQAEDAGEYSVLVSSACGTIRSRPAFLTLNPSLQIFSSAGTATLIWRPDPGLVLESADAVTGPWTIVTDPPNPFTVGGGPARFFRHRLTE